MKPAEQDAALDSGCIGVVGDSLVHPQAPPLVSLTKSSRRNGGLTIPGVPFAVLVAAGRLGSNSVRINVLHKSCFLISFKASGHDRDPHFIGHLRLSQHAETPYVSRDPEGDKTVKSGKAVSFS
jgi:hypothetical protein